MARWNPIEQMQDLINKLGGEEGIKRIQSGELVLVERNAPTMVSPQGLANGGVTYASVLNAEAFLDDWKKFLKDIFKISLPSRKKIVLPKTRPGFGWGVLTPKGMTIEQALASYADICPIWRWTNKNLDEITESIRSADHVRVVWVRDRIDADGEYKDKSYNDLRAVGINSITLTERLLLGRWFYWKTSGHLDVVNITRCDGSRCSGDGVPGLGWSSSSGGLCVVRYNPDVRDDYLRSREAVS